MIEPSFTERVHRIVALATADAKRRQHGAVEGEHLLLGLIAEGRGVGVAALHGLGVNPAELQTRIEGSLRPRESASATDRGVVLSAAAQRVLDLAVTEARTLEHAYVGSEHLLIAFLREDSIAARLLFGTGVSLAGVRHEVQRLLGAPATPE